MSFGPYVHAINKGGLDEIIRTQQLVSTTARGIAGGGDAVRAHVGSFKAVADRLGWSRKFSQSANGSTDGKYIEFTTERPPRSGMPPFSAQWPMEAGEYLKIRITGVFDEFGHRVL